MTPSQVTDLLELEVLDDYYGLWEILWAMQAEFPNHDEAVRRDAAQAGLAALVRKGNIMVYRGLSFTGEEQLVPDPEIESALADEWWAFRGAEWHTRVTLSEGRKREVLYRAGAPPPAQ